jgi:hypothetical protein
MRPTLIAGVFECERWLSSMAATPRPGRPFTHAQNACASLAASLAAVFTGGSHSGRQAGDDPSSR